MAMLSPSQRESLTRAAEKYHNSLTESPAIGYLASRGIEDIALDPTFLLGYVGEPEIGHEHMRGRLSIPYVTPAGVVNIKARCIRDHDCKTAECPKYIYPAGSKSYLYNVGAFKTPLPYLGITEGELDALCLQGGAGIPAVGVPGVKAWTAKPHWPLCFQGFEQIFVFADPDEAGEGLAKRICDSIDSATVVRLPAGEDVNKCYQVYGAGFLRELIGLE